jgi:hypothetical protein
MQLAISVGKKSLTKSYKVPRMIRVHRQCCGEDLEPKYIDNLCYITSPFRIIHLGELIVVYQCFQINSSTFLIAIVLNRSGLIIESQIELRESLILIDFGLTVERVELQPFFRRGKCFNSFLFSEGTH